MLRDDIREGEAALLCTTDRNNCCRSSDGQAAGEFYFPDNITIVPIAGPDLSIRTYYRNRGTGFIRLNRRPNGHETGRFHCEIPDQISGMQASIYIDIGIQIISL